MNPYVSAAHLLVYLPLLLTYTLGAGVRDSDFVYHVIALVVSVVLVGFHGYLFASGRRQSWVPLFHVFVLGGLLFTSPFLAINNKVQNQYVQSGLLAIIGIGFLLHSVRLAKYALKSTKQL